MRAQCLRRRWYATSHSSAGNNISRSGAGSDLTGLMLDDESWTVALNASIPVFSGGALRARLSRSQYELARLHQQHAALSESIDTEKAFAPDATASVATIESKVRFISISPWIHSQKLF